MIGNMQAATSLQLAAWAMAQLQSSVHTLYRCWLWIFSKDKDNHKDKDRERDRDKDWDKDRDNLACTPSSAESAKRERPALQTSSRLWRAPWKATFPCSLCSGDIESCAKPSDDFCPSTSDSANVHLCLSIYTVFSQHLCTFVSARTRQWQSWERQLRLFRRRR